MRVLIASVALFASPLAGTGGLATAQQSEDFRVEATFGSSEIRVGESVILQIVAERSGREGIQIDIPPLPDGLAMVGSSEGSSLSVEIPGGISRIQRRTLVLEARREGRFRLRPVTATSDRETVRSTPLELRVVPGPPRARSDGIIEYGGSWSDEVVVEGTLSADTVYVGEQVTLTGRTLITPRAERALRRDPRYLLPAPSSFWTEELESGVFGTRMTGGRQYRSRTFRRAYVPISPGEFMLEPVRLEMELRGGLARDAESLVVRSDSLPLVVLPLPEAGQPEGFTGAVGSYSIESTLQPTRTSVGQAATFRVTVSGAGYVPSLPDPELPPLSGVEIYPPQERSETEVAGGTLRGWKSLSWVLQPERAGAVEIPPIEFPYFDPEEEAYHVARTSRLTLEVSPASGGSVAGGSRIRGLMAPSPDGGSLQWVESRWFALGQALPVLALGLVAWRRRRQQRVRRVSRLALWRQRRKLLSELESLAPDEGSRGAALIRMWLEWRLGEIVVSTSIPDLRELLDSHGVEASTSADAAELFSGLENVRYRPSDGGKAETGLSGIEARAASAANFPSDAGTRDLIVRIDRQADAPALASPDRFAGGSDTAGGGGGQTSGGRWRGAAFALVVGVVAMLVTVAALGIIRSERSAADLDRSTLSATVPDFAAAAENYHAGRYEEAVAGFEAYAASTPGDPAGWYNAGNARFQLGEYGRATAAWLSALRRAPRHDAPRHNLAVAGARPALVDAVRPAIPLNLRERLLLSAFAWFLAAAAIILYMWTRRGWSIFAGACAVLVAIAVWAPELRAPDVPVAVVVSTAPVNLRAEPARHGGSIGTMREGEGVLVRDVRDTWLRVRLLAGAADAEADEGWLPREAVLTVADD